MASQVTVLTPSRRFRGAAIWCDLKRGDFFAAMIQRAILRPGSLALEVERDGRQYDASLRVALRETPGQVFGGPWQAKWNAGRKPAQESGRARVPGNLA